MGNILGIDFGTTYYCASYVDVDGVVRCISSPETGLYTTPSVVYFKPNGEVVVGETAKTEGGFNPECMVQCVKNYLSDPSYIININGFRYNPVDISSLVAQKLLYEAQLQLDDGVYGAVITVPAYWTHTVDHALVRAFESVTLKDKSKLKVLSVISEPIAAVLGLKKACFINIPQRVLVYDLGGGTFDCSILHVDFSKREAVIVTLDGNHQLGGKDWDACLADYVRNEFCSRTGIDPEKMIIAPESIQWFSDNIEKAKIALSTKETISLTPSFNDVTERVEISREIFEKETEHLIEQTFSIMEGMFEKHGLNIETEIDAILLVGGSTYMPQVKEKLVEKYNKQIIAKHQDQIIAIGAAIYGNEMLACQ